MADRFNPTKRAAVMRAVKSRNTTPELRVRGLLRRLKIGYRLHAPDLPGKPDLVFRGRRKVIFVHGCFWHGHTCARGARMPAANRAYWQTKIARTQARDKAHLTALSQVGWSALVVWECEMRDEPALARRLGAYLACGSNGSPS
ncbi:MAG: very short patch repair endonuclease [Caulobacterales bacterium]|jgi:DNA mismatch endonuclease (patch repair protein)